jgi:uncharacterized membrane protein (UPF0127 family)
MKAQKSKTAIITVVVVLVLILLLVGYSFMLLKPVKGLQQYSIGSIALDQNELNRTVNVYLAISYQQQENGLMNQSTMGNCNGRGNCYGMLFLFPSNSNLCFWMKNTIMPLKQIWITNNTITAIENATPYSTVSYCHNGDEVLETQLNSTLSVGDNVYLKSSYR